MHRDGKPKGFFYLDHRTVDSKANIITDVFVTPGNTNDVKPYINRLDEQIAKFGFEVETVGLDAGYNVLWVIHCYFLRDFIKITLESLLKRGFVGSVNCLIFCYCFK